MKKEHIFSGFLFYIFSNFLIHNVEVIGAILFLIILFNWIFAWWPNYYSWNKNDSVNSPKEKMISEGTLSNQNSIRQVSNQAQDCVQNHKAISIFQILKRPNMLIVFIFKFQCIFCQVTVYILNICKMCKLLISILRENLTAKLVI
jgi:hypothetical protein